MSAQKKSAKKAAKTPGSDIVHVRLPNATIEKLDALAAENNTSRNAMVQIAISKLLKSGL